jgi:flavin-dependent dehydrogenase
MTDPDVVIVGGGVAGCVSAMHLLRAGYRVRIIHAHQDIAAAESLSPDAVQQLARFGVFIGVPLDRIVAWWGGNEPTTIQHPGARLVERIALGDALRQRALDAGAELATGRLRSVTRAAGRWKVAFSPERHTLKTTNATHIVDASGRASVVGLRSGAERRNMDELFCASVTITSVKEFGTWTESARNGWWNFCSTTGIGTLSFFSNAEGIRMARKDLARAFAATRHLREVLAGTVDWCTVKVRCCGSSMLDSCAGSDWVAVGDAVSTLQPLASGGLSKAVRDASILRSAIEHSWRRYVRLQQDNFADYRMALRRQYASETRWRNEVFWAACHGGDGLRPNGLYPADSPS